MTDSLIARQPHARFKPDPVRKAGRAVLRPAMPEPNWVMGRLPAALRLAQAIASRRALEFLGSIGASPPTTKLAHARFGLEFLGTAIA